MFLPSSFWRDVPLTELQENDTHVWYISLQASSDELNYFSQILNEEEKSRAARFHFDKHRMHFTIARAVMRILLGNYLKKEARQVQFQYQKRGKPYVEEHIYFNISHSGDRALFAINKKHELGVDIELMRDNVSWEQIATRYFSQTEIMELSQTSDKKIAFFRGWSRKEAYIKAIGDGLTMPLASFYVPLIATENLSIHHNDPRTWGLWNLEVGENYAGAIVVQTQNTNIRKYTYDG